MLQFFKNFSEISLAEKSELDIYMDLPVHFLTKKNDPILWWKINCNTFPQLSEIARNYLSIPASSTLSERLFSSAGNILTKKWNWLDLTTVLDLLFLYQNSKTFTVVPK